MPEIKKDEPSSSKSCILGGKKIAVLFTVGILLALVGGTFYPLVDRLVQSKINENLVLKPGSESYKNWKAPTAIPIYLQFFVFDIVNYMEAKENQRPVVEQKGPYSYREYREKKNVTWSSSSEPAMVTYNEEKWFVFDPETSCKSCDPYSDYVTTVNVPLVTLAEAGKNWPFVVKAAITGLFDAFKENLFTRRKVHDLVWGYPDPLLKKYAEIRNDLVKKFPFLENVLPNINPIIALQQNKSFDGFTTIYTGTTDIAQLERWVRWNGKSKVEAWNTSYANMINGTDGTQFSPGASKHDTLYVFVTELCRSLYLTYNSDVSIQGISALQFTVPKELFLNASLNPNNQAFCTDKCYPTGILDVSVCQNSSISLPIFVSAPHFYQGDHKLVENVEGLNPNEHDHGTFLDVEPHTGLPISSSKRLQLNVLIQPIEYIKQTAGIKTAFIPVIYFNETASIDKKLANELKQKVFTILETVHGLELGLVALGGLLIIIATVLLALLIQRNRNLKKLRELLISNTGETTPLLKNYENEK